MLFVAIIHLSDAQFIIEYRRPIFYDVRSITTEQRNEISTNFGTEGLVVLMICLALYDGAFRVMSVLGHWEKFSE